MDFGKMKDQVKDQMSQKVKEELKQKLDEVKLDVEKKFGTFGGQTEENSEQSANTSEPKEQNVSPLEIESLPESEADTEPTTNPSEETTQGKTAATETGSRKEITDDQDEKAVA